VSSADAPVVNSIEYRDTGIILKVTPRVNESGLVMMDVAQEVSDVSATTSSSLNSPTISERKINSTIAVQDGETVALGGLIKDSRSHGLSGIPVLQDIPYIGPLFGDTNDSVTRTELLVLITPRVVQGVQKLRSVTEEMNSGDTIPNPPSSPASCRVSAGRAGGRCGLRACR
jgi:general secretion pathway protein D